MIPLCKLKGSRLFLILFFFLIIMTFKKESFVNYPEMINESIDRVKYENINKELNQQNRVFTPNSYHKNTDMYSLDYQDVNCHPLEIPSTFYRK